MPVIPPLGSGCRGIQSSKSPLEIQGVPDQPGQHETASQNILMFHYDVSHIHISLYFARMCTHTLLFLSVHPLVYFLPSDGPPSEFPSYIFLKLDSIRGKVGYLTFLVSHCLLLLTSLIRVETKSPSLRPSLLGTRSPFLWPSCNKALDYKQEEDGAM